MANYEYIYSGGGYSLDENSGDFIGYRIPSGRLGAPLKPDSAAQIVEATNMLNQGIKPIEVGVLSPDVFEQIPQQHFKEINRLMKITGATASLHAPLIEASGYVENNWDKANQTIAENRLIEVVDKAHELDPEGNIPVTIHSTNIPGATFVPKEGGGYKESQIFVVDAETGKIAGALREEERYELETGGLKVFKPREELEKYNKQSWQSELTHFSFNAERGEDLVNYGERAFDDPMIKELYNNYISGKLTEKDLQENLELTKFVGDFKRLERNRGIGETFLKDAYLELKKMYNTAYKSAVEKNNQADINLLNNLSKEIQQKKNQLGNIEVLGEIIEKGINTLRQVDDAPILLKPIEEFALDKSTETFSNVAFHAYKKYGDKSPIISLENLYPGMAFAKPEDFKKLVDETKKKFIKKAVENGFSESEAKKAADTTIGVTWDVGHLNMMRKQGFKEEDIVKATKLIAKDIKHVHITDNFGYSDSHLPAGMGNVPIKKILEQLEKAGVLDNAKLIHEAGGFVQHFKTSPHPYALEAFGSPIYSMKMAPYWNQAYNTMGNYFAGYGTMLPDQHMSMYGSGFSSLPTELGGQVQQKASRFSGTPNA